MLVLLEMDSSAAVAAVVAVQELALELLVAIQLNTHIPAEQVAQL
jgi:hypothetical protein